MLLKRWIWNALKSVDTESLLRVLNPKLRDLSGVLNHPGYRFRAHDAGTITVPTSAWTTLPLDTEVFDVGGIYDTSTGEVTIPADGAGPWLFVGSIWYAADATGNRQCGIWQTNPSSLTLSHDQVTPTAAIVGVSTATIEEVAAGDRYALRGWQNSGGDLATTQPRYQTFFAGTRLLGRIPG